jgi:hypothetical protein
MFKYQPYSILLHLVTASAIIEERKVEIGMRLISTPEPSMKKRLVYVFRVVALRHLKAYHNVKES